MKSTWTNTNKLFASCCSAVLLWTASMSSYAAPAQTISIRSDEWCPFICDPKSDKPGIMIEIARKAFPAPDYTLDVQFLEWSKALDETRDGKFTMVAGAYKTDAPDFIFPTEGQVLTAIASIQKPKATGSMPTPHR